MVDAILTATARILAQGGAARLTTNRVADVAGVSVGSLYQYFPDKQALMAALIEREAQADLERLGQTMMSHAHRPLPEVLAVFARLMVDHHAKAPRLYREMFHSVATVQQDNTLRAVQERAHAGMAGVLEMHRSELRVADPQWAAFMAVETARGVVEAAVELGRMDRDADALARELTDLLTRYLCAPAAPAAPAGPPAVSRRRPPPPRPR